MGIAFLHPARRERDAYGDDRHIILDDAASSLSSSWVAAVGRAIRTAGIPSLSQMFYNPIPHTRTATMNALQSLLEQGQSIWYDFISRDFIATGAMKELVDQGLRGMTSTPTIFEKSIAGVSAYDEQI